MSATVKLRFYSDEVPDGMEPTEQLKANLLDQLAYLRLTVDDGETTFVLRDIVIT